jgi:hypothetical protein
VVTARLEIGRGEAAPTLVCVEPATILTQRVLARVVSRVEADPERPARDSALTKLTKQEVMKNRTCVFLANFSNTPLHVPKSTVMGLAETISETVVNLVNPTVQADKVPTKEGNTCNSALYRKLLKDKLDHLPRADRRVLEPILIQVCPPVPRRRFERLQVHERSSASDQTGRRIPHTKSPVQNTIRA